MLKLRHSYLLFLCGLLWMVVGCFLLPLGLNFIIETLLKKNGDNYYPVLQFLSNYVGGNESAALFWVGIALLIGVVKGRTVFAKSVQRSVTRIRGLPNPVSVTRIYSPAYYLLLGSMGLLGFLFKFAPLDVRGGVDVAVGCALIQGSFFYFREAWAARYIRPAG